MAAQLAGVPYAALPTAAKAASALAQPPRLVVIHDTSNTASAAQEAAYAASRPLSGATSAHFYVDGTGPLGSVPLNIQAWAAYSYANSHGWHIEMCGYNAGMPGAVPAKTIALTAVLVRQLCQLGSIPMVKLSPADVAAGKRGVCGHWDITTGLNVGTHDDPGPKFDWPSFIAAVNGDDMGDPVLEHNTAWMVQRLVENADPVVVPANKAIGAPGFTIPNSLAQKLVGLDNELDTVREQMAAVKEQLDAIDSAPVITDEQLERVLRRVMGSVDGASPAES